MLSMAKSNISVTHLLACAMAEGVKLMRSLQGPVASVRHSSHPPFDSACKRSMSPAVTGKV